MPIDYTNPSVLKFVVENFTKENERRVLWFNKNQAEILKAAASNRASKYRTEDVLRANVELCIPSLAVQHGSSSINRRRTPIRDGVMGAPAKGREVESAGGTPTAIMMPVEADVAAVLRQSQPGGGRLQYLRRRAGKPPELRYYFCETSSNACGWRLGDAKPQYSRSHRRVYAYRRDVLARAGPQPDPPHYAPPLATKNFKCSTY